MTRPRCVLVGAPGAGKTTVGRAVADALGVPFRDTDTDVEAAAGKPVADIFLTDGEDAFRALEAAAVATALVQHEGVLALGGGAVLDAETRSRLAGHRVVWLQVSLADAAGRVGLNRDRPLLIGSPRAQLKTLMDARRPLYDEVATDVVDTSGRPVVDIAADVVDLLATPVPPR